VLVLPFMGASDARDVRRAQGRRIRRARNAADLTLVELVRRLAERGVTVTPQAISAWERGETSPRLWTRDILCAVLDVSPHDVFGTEL
jgi:transcriptional regulator with XRE-family HTH domain